MPGNLIGLEINGNFVSCEMSCEFNYEGELLPASPMQEGGWAEWIMGVKTWNISLNAGMLLRMMGTGLPEVLNAFLKGEKLNIRFGTNRVDMPNFLIVGKVWPGNGTISAGVNARANWNTTFKGDGPFTIEINTNTAYALGTGMKEREALQDGNKNIVGGRDGISFPEI